MRTKTYDRRKRAGLCVQCGASLNGATAVRCKTCREGQSKYLDSHQIERQPTETLPHNQNTEERCACLLLLPCNRCIPTARELAEQRFAVDFCGVAE